MSRISFLSTLGIFVLLAVFLQDDRMDTLLDPAIQAELAKSDPEAQGLVATAIESASTETTPRAVGSNDDSEWNLPTLGLASTLSVKEILQTERYSLEDGRVKRSSLFRTEKSILRRDEIWELEGNSGRWVLSKDVYMRGDVFSFELDPGRVDTSEFEDFLADRSLSVSWRSRLSDFVQLKLENPSLEALDLSISLASKQFEGLVVEEDLIYFPSDLPNDYNAARMWNLDQVSADDAWELETGESDVIVAVIDTGADVAHPDLVDNLWVNSGEIANNGLDDDGNGFIDDIHGWDFYDDDNSPNDELGHGTHVTGTIAARGNNGQGLPGIAWTSKVMILKVGEDDGLSNQAISEALRYAQAMKARGEKVVATNNSYGGGSSSVSMRLVIDQQKSEGILFVAAAGNDGVDIDGGSAQYPASYTHENVISVANTAQDDVLVSSSNYGSTSVDLAAPGRSVYSTNPGGAYGYKTGTSMASPLVAGAAALVSSHNPELSWREIKDRILDTVDEVGSLSGKVLTGGRLNVLAAVDSNYLDFGFEVVNHSGNFVFVPNIDHPVVFELGVPSGVRLAAEVLEGGNSIAVVEGSKVSCTFADLGVYTIRFTASVSDISKSLDRTVFVGKAPDVVDGLLHRYDFEGSGTEVIDLANEGDGTLTNATREESGLGNSVRFSGSNSKMAFESQSSEQVTVTALINPDRISHNAHPRIVNTPDYYLYVSSGDNVSEDDGNRNVLKFYSNRDGGNYGVWNTEPNTISTGSWMHVAATYDSRSLSNNPEMYINGNIESIRTQITPSGTQTTGGGAAYLGDRADGSRSWDGFIDEVRVYNRVLSPKEISIVSAQYFESRWNAFDIRAKSEDGAQTMQFGFEDAVGESADARYEWTLIDVIGSAEVSGSDTNQVSLDTESLKSAVLQLLVSDSAGSQYFYYPIIVPSEPVRAGIYRSVDAEGSVVWVEVDESLEFGYISVFGGSAASLSLKTKFYIDSTGVIFSDESMENAVGGIVGESVHITFSGNESQYSAAFSESLFEQSAYAGSYSGGLISEAEAYVEVEVGVGGDLLLIRRGEVTDLVHGTHRDNGTISLQSVSGAVYTGAFSEDGKSFTGSVALGEDVFSIFLKKEGEASDSTFINLSTRGDVQSGERLLIGGFVIPEGENRDVLLRAVGPSLTALGVANPLSNPKIDLVKNSEVLASNDDWGTNAAELSQVFENVGSFTFEDGSHDAALKVNLGPGAYTALVSSADGVSSGEALVEIYDIDNTVKALKNVSTRGFVQGSEKVLIGGFEIEGSEPKKVLIRGVGPGLEDKGVVEFLENPKIELVRGREMLTENDDWTNGVSVESEDLGSSRAFEVIESMFTETGAFPLDEGSSDAAMLVWLEPGVYTVLLSGEADQQGIALIEIYDLP